VTGRSPRRPGRQSARAGPAHLVDVPASDADLARLRLGNRDAREGGGDAVACGRQPGFGHFHLRAKPFKVAPGDQLERDELPDAIGFLANVRQLGVGLPLA
jgi:hypothetical protein